MNINKYKPTEEFFFKKTAQTAENVNNISTNKPGQNSYEQDSVTNSVMSGMIEGLNRLSPVEQYGYLDSVGKAPELVKLEAVPGNPQKTIARANRVINRAIMPPAFDNPQRRQLSDAFRLKRSAESQLDKAA